MVETDPANPHSDAPNPASVDALVDVFRRHGITLVIDPNHTELPHATFMSLTDEELPCAQDVARVWPWLGGTSVTSFAALKAQYFHPRGNVPWHYAIFGHAGAYGLGNTNSCYLTTGAAWIPGYDFMVTTGYFFHSSYHNLMWQCAQDFSLYRGMCLRTEAGAFMHELGHNLDLRHGGGDDWIYKPNYLSVMNYYFQRGIPFAESPGSTVIAGYRLDYSDRLYPTLDENNLDEGVGLGGPPDDVNITFYSNNEYSPGPINIASATGPIDWNGDGTIESGVQDDLLAAFPETWWGNFIPLTGFDDWAHVQQFLNTPAYKTGRVPRGPAVP